MKAAPATIDIRAADRRRAKEIPLHIRHIKRPDDHAALSKIVSDAAEWRKENDRKAARLSSIGRLTRNMLDTLLNAWSGAGPMMVAGCPCLAAVAAIGTMKPSWGRQFHLSEERSRVFAAVAAIGGAVAAAGLAVASAADGWVFLGVDVAMW